ncbi:hypothetical protein ACVWZA_000995 [Sphingomonas sp. UYAg733]
MFYSMGASYGSNQERSNKQASAYAADAPKRVERECAGLAGTPLAECATKIVQAARESERDESDLGAQWQAANWVLWATIIAGTQLLATAVGTALLYQQIVLTRKAVEDTGEATEAMREANALSKDTAARQLRAYITVKKVEFVGRSPFKSRLLVKLFYENFGETPAFNVRTQLRAEFVEGGDASSPIAPPPRQAGGSESPLAKNMEQTTIDEVGIVVEGVHIGGQSAARIMREVKAGRGIIFAHGWITYEDAFERCHSVSFKWYYDKRSHLDTHGFVVGIGGNMMGECEDCQSSKPHLHNK